MGLERHPEFLRDTDRVFIDYKEALLIEKVRNEFFTRLEALVMRRANELDAG